MKNSKKFFVLLVFVNIGGCLWADYPEWDGSDDIYDGGEYQVSESLNLYGVDRSISNGSKLYIVSGGTLTMEFGTLNVNGVGIEIQNGGSLQIAGLGILRGNGVIDVLSGGILQVQAGGDLMRREDSGQVTIASGGSLEVQSDANIVICPNGIANAGTFTLFGATASTPDSSIVQLDSGLATIGSVGSVVICSGAQMIVSSGASLQDNSLGTGLAIDENAFLQVQSGGSLSIENGGFNFYGDLDIAETFTIFGALASTPDSSTIQLNSGTCALSSGKSLSVGLYKNLSVQNNVLLEVQGGGYLELLYDGLFTVGNGGTFEIESSGNVYINDKYCTVESGGAISIKSGASLSLYWGGLDIMTGADFNFSGNITAQSLSVFGCIASVPNTSTIQINSGTFTIAEDSFLTIGSGKSFYIAPGVAFEFLGTVTNNGTLNLFGTTVSTPDINTIQTCPGQKTLLSSGNGMTLGAGRSLVIQSDSSFIVDTNSWLKNLSSSTIDVYGQLKIPGLLENGSTLTAGTINIYNKGTLLIPGGTVINKNVDSAINIKRGGSILNYYGTLDSLLGTCSVDAGGLISNENGVFNYTSSAVTFSAGAVFFDGDHVQLHHDLDIDFTWTITMAQTMNGNGNFLHFLSGGVLKIAPGESLLLKNICIDGVSGGNICCMDNTATLSLGNVIWVQDGNYSFSLGKIDIIGDVIVQGPGTQFGYSSSVTSTIHHNASLLFDNQTTFSYLAAGSPSLIAMEDNSSVFAFDNAKLYTEQDMRLSRGHLLLDNGVTLSVALAKTLYFGDKTNHAGDAMYDLDLDMCAAVNVGVSGNVVIDNVNA